MIKIFVYIIYFMILIFSSSVVAKDRLKIAVTTSIENSGLFSVLLPPFEKKYQVKMFVLAVGTGKALKLGENGDVDLVLVHAPDAEKRFIDAAYGVSRVSVMHNDFVLLGPTSDPAGVKSVATLTKAFNLIYKSKSKFISRGDNSGTHKKELKLWEIAGIKPVGEWYFSIGQGMGAALTMAYEKQSYILSDRGTYLAYQGKTNLDIVYENDAALENPYHIIMVNPEHHPHIKTEMSQRFINYITGVDGQKIIRDFRINGEALFYPDVIK